MAHSESGCREAVEHFRINCGIILGEETTFTFQQKTIFSSLQQKYKQNVISYY